MNVAIKIYAKIYIKLIKMKIRKFNCIIKLLEITIKMSELKFDMFLYIFSCFNALRKNSKRDNNYANQK